MTVRDGNGDRGRNEHRHAELAQRSPQITVLSDGALPAEQAHRDTFDLWVKLGPIYDIIRHPDTQTPIAIGVFGRWGSGKTTAMRWLQGSLEVWNEQGRSTGNEPKISVRTVWFDPWKYDSREDVWRGLLAEVILTSLEGKSGADAKKVLKDFGRFLGSSFIDVLDGRFKGWGVKGVADNARSFLRPDKEYLNEYENKMREWLEESLGPNRRMVIFIDDLDRCLPEVALEVLEGIKLYLGFEQLIFVVGVDKTMIEYLVQAHYDEVLKLESSKAVDTALADDHRGDERRSGRDYLAKMFQVEVLLEPTQQEIRGFLEEQLDSLGFLSELDPDELTMLKDLILELAQQSPREVNRLLNSALMAGAGSRYASDASDHEQDVPEDLRFRQGLQGFFLRRILEQPEYRFATALGLDWGRRFFHDWSEVVTGSEGAPITVNMSQALEGAQRRTDTGVRTAISGGEQTDTGVPTAISGEERVEPLAGVPKPYIALAGWVLDHSNASLMVTLLTDKRVGRLMQIPYPEPPSEAETLAMAAPTRVQIAQISEAFARSLGKAPEDVSARDFADIDLLDLRGLEITDLSALEPLTNLITLNLDGTPVADLSPLRDLTTLTNLSLDGTPVADLSTLQSLTNLTDLYLAETPVTDLSPLRDLTNLTFLVLNGTQVTDLSPLQNLTNLTFLVLNGTPVADLSTLQSLTNLTDLYLAETPVTDLSPLQNLTTLTNLYLGDETRVAHDQREALEKALPKLSITVGLSVG